MYCIFQNISYNTFQSKKIILLIYYFLYIYLFIDNRTQKSAIILTLKTLVLINLCIEQKHFKFLIVGLYLTVKKYNFKESNKSSLNVNEQHKTTEFLPLITAQNDHHSLPQSTVKVFICKLISLHCSGSSLTKVPTQVLLC